MAGGGLLVRVRRPVRRAGRADLDEPLGYPIGVVGCAQAGIYRVNVNLAEAGGGQDPLRPSRVGERERAWLAADRQRRQWPDVCGGAEQRRREPRAGGSVAEDGRGEPAAGAQGAADAGAAGAAPDVKDILARYRPQAAGAR